MSKRTILLILFLCALAVAAPAQSAAQKAWPAFWKSFATAVEKQNKPVIKRMMASEREFFSGGGAENRVEWMQMIADNGSWPMLVRSVRGGTKPFSDHGHKGPGRITNDNSLIFVYLRGRWQFVGVMGD